MIECPCCCWTLQLANCKGPPPCLTDFTGVSWNSPLDFFPSFFVSGFRYPKNRPTSHPKSSNDLHLGAIWEPFSSLYWSFSGNGPHAIRTRRRVRIACPATLRRTIFPTFCSLFSDPDFACFFCCFFVIFVPKSGLLDLHLERGWGGR